MVERLLWAQAVDGATLGLAGAAQVFRIDHHVDFLRKGRVFKTTDETFYGVTSLWPEEAAPAVLLHRVREYWSIEIKQHYRRDHTQREDHCQVRHTHAARNLALMRSASIFLYERQRGERSGKQSLPDWQRKNLRQPNPLIGKLTAQPG